MFGAWRGALCGALKQTQGRVFRPHTVSRWPSGVACVSTRRSMLRGNAYVRWLQQRPLPLVSARTKSLTTASAGFARDPVLAVWLLGTGAMVFGMVTLGGATRLTRSGLSMVDWRPQGRKLPSTVEEWTVEFEKYKAFPEYQRLNQGMTLAEFKRIYFMEWAHRMWGRAIGVVFAVPMLGFLVMRRIPKELYGRLGLLFAMGGGQGLVGWWMVKSGLTHEHLPGIERSEHDQPRVSPYRLAAHLTMAFATYGVLAWTGLALMDGPGRFSSMPTLGGAAVEKSLRTLKRRCKGGAALLGLTVISGAFVAGNDAGHAYNDFPYMAGRWIPEQIWMDGLGVRNLFENTATVQFDHRLLAFATLGTVGGLFATSRGNPMVWASLRPDTKLAMKALVGVAGAQVGLGITTLMMYVPVELGVAHQAGALTLWTVALYVVHTLRYVK
jgi:heme a synthase